MSFSIKYVHVLIFKILALIALSIWETFVTVLYKLVSDTGNFNVYCVLKSNQNVIEKFLLQSRNHKVDKKIYMM